MIPISGYLKVIGGVLIAIVIGFAFTKTYDFGFQNAQTIGDKNLANYKASIDTATASSVSAAFADFASGVARGQATETQFIADQHADDTRAADLKEQIDHVAQPHVTAPQRPVTAASANAADPVYRCVFSRGFVRLWNAAAGASDASDAAVPSGSDSGSAALDAGTDEAADSGVSQRDLIDWLVDFANVKHADERKLSAIAGLQSPPSTVAVPASAASDTQ